MVDILEGSVLLRAPRAQTFFTRAAGRRANGRRVDVRAAGSTQQKQHGCLLICTADIRRLQQYGEASGTDLRHVNIILEELISKRNQDMPCGVQDTCGTSLSATCGRRVTSILFSKLNM